MREEIIVPDIFEIQHECLTDDGMLQNTISFVKANNKIEAQTKFNKLALKRKNPPYLWNQVSLENIKNIKIII